MSTNLRNPADRRDYPARWTMRRGKELFREIDERSVDGSEELLSVSHITGITPRSQKNVTMFQSESLVGYKICRPGDIAANTMWTWQGAIGVSDYFGVISPSYNVYRQRQDTYNPRYLDFLLREPKLVDVYYSLSTGIRPSRRRLYPDEFLTIRFPVPPRAEQDKIVRFLDDKANAIDEVIATRQKQIDELHELRKTIINRAVTRGISRAEGAEREGACPHAPPGVQDGWKKVRLKNCIASSFSGVWGNEPNSNLLSIICYRIADFDYAQGGIRGNNLTIRGYLPSEIKGRIVKYGDLLIEKSGGGDVMPVGRVIFVDRHDDVATCSNFIQQLRCSKYACSKFLYYLFYSLYAKGMTRLHYTQTIGIQNLKVASYLNTSILLPPADEQREIAAYLDEKCAAIDKAIENRKAAIEELAALKARIVADAVTGRMEVE